MTLFQLVPISEKPSKEDRYVVTNGLGLFEVQWDEQYGFHAEFTDCSELTHYLRPLDPSILEKLLGDTWDAGGEHEYRKHFGTIPNQAPDKQTTIDKLLKEIV